MLEILIAYLKATFENSMPEIAEVQGMAEQIEEGNKRYPVFYCTKDEYKQVSSLENYLYFRQRGPATEAESFEESVSGCDEMITRTYPMVAVAYIPKSVYNTDNAFIDGKIGQNISNILRQANIGSLNATLKTENVYVEVTQINTNRNQVWASEYRGIDMKARMDHVLCMIEFDIVVEASDSCLQNWDCNDEQVVVNGDTITVNITDSNAWHKSGDNLPEIKTLGSTNNQDWRIIHNNVTIATLKAAGVQLDVLNAKATAGTIFLTTDNGVITSRTAAQVKSDIGAGSGDGTVTSVGLLAGTSGTDVNITGSPITGAGNITINIPDASAANRGLVTIGDQTFAGVKTFASAPILTGFTQGSVLFAGVGGVVSQDNAGLFWDDATNRLGIGTNTPTDRVTLNFSIPVVKLNSTVDTQASSVTFTQIGVTKGYFQHVHSNNLSVPANRRDAIEIGSNGANNIIAFRGNGELARFQNNSLLIGSTTGSSKLHVVGAGPTSATWTAQFHNSTGTSNSLMIRDNGRIGILNADPQEALHVTGNVRLGLSGSNGYYIDWGQDAVTSSGSFARIQGIRTNGAGNQAGDLVFYTKERIIGGVSPDERWRIFETGKSRFELVHTATANNDYGWNFTGTLTARSTANGGAGDTLAGQYLTPTLVAGANNQRLVAHRIAGTFTNGAFTGVVNIGLDLGNTLLLGRLAADPTTAENGMIYYNTTTNKFRGYEGGAWANLI